MEDQYWRFANQAEAMSALTAAKLITSGTITTVGALDLVGAISYGGKFDYEARRLISPPLTYSGYHVNYRGPVVASLAKYRVFPSSPSRKFA